METLEQFIQSNPDTKELKRALAIQMSERGHNYREIRDVLQVSLGFVTNSKQRYDAEGIEGLRSKYWGTQGYLSKLQKQEIYNWLEQKDYWMIEEMIDHIEEHYGILYQSQQSYYNLLKQGGFSWKKSQPKHPDKDEAQIVEKKKRLQRC